MKTRTPRLILPLYLTLAAPGCGAGPGASASEPPSETPDRRRSDSEGLEAAPESSGQTAAPHDMDPGAPAQHADSADAPSGTDDSLPLPSGTKVLHVGDSFAGALGIPLGELFESKGVRSVLKHTDSSYLTDWAWDGNLQKYIWKYNPDLVMVTLGANELEIVKPELREKTVKKIVETIGGRPCVWVAIPLWDGPKNGLLDVIKKNSAPCVYMDTNALFDTTKMPRISDGIHPTTEARKTWAVDVLGWLRSHRKPTPEMPWNIE